MGFCRGWRVATTTTTVITDNINNDDEWTLDWTLVLAWRSPKNICVGGYPILENLAKTKGNMNGQGSFEYLD